MIEKNYFYIIGESDEEWIFQFAAPSSTASGFDGSFADLEYGEYRGTGTCIDGNRGAVSD